ncbi:hypothetical protein HNR42_001136 [Deinobacterium chartae]|uniref:Lipoprotein n=1 Tax=Deinobacterium chartae TaxID=521158 RepID=A0A841HZU3_9DEIO|nr:hypothetical protein [Deinobacterium chartae]MBB6097719.1 hypothetical protein [Deinobacterium chartae]
MKHFLKWLGAAALLTSCSNLSLVPTADIGVATSDAGSAVTVVRKVDDEGKVSYDVSEAGPVEFTFTARPGSIAANIVGYKITRYLVDGQDLAEDPVVPNMKQNIYVASGYTCEERRTEGTAEAAGLASCVFSKAEAAPGVPSQTLSLNFAAGLVELVKANNSSVSAEIDIVFIARDANGKQIELPVVSGVVARGIFQGTL